jgi:kynurenine formamidase
MDRDMDVSPHRLSTSSEVEAFLRDNRNWNRWGSDDARGTVNLITAQKRVAASSLVKSGRVVSLSRAIDTEPSAANPSPALQFWTIGERPHGGGHSGDFLAVQCHGTATTHLDALCHLWDQDGLYNGRDPRRVIDTTGAHFGGVEVWAEGLIGRGIMIDVVRHRGHYVTQDEPVHGWELEEIVNQRGVGLEAGDILCVNSGRESWQAAHPDRPYGQWRDQDGLVVKPGLHASCLPFLRQHDIAALVWDMMDLTPTGYDVPWTVHGAIPSFGLALIDNAVLEPLAKACIQEDTDRFLFIAVPLLLPKATGSLVNPLAMF